MKVARGDPGGGTASLIIAVETSACNDARFYVITTNAKYTTTDIYYY